jgi:hypothetical protein
LVCQSLTAQSKVQLPFDVLTALSIAEGPLDMLTALSKDEGLRYASSFVIAAYCKYASFLKICKPCIWSFLLCRLIFDFLRVYQSFG